MPEPLELSQQPPDFDQEPPQLKSVHFAGQEITASKDRLASVAGPYLKYVAEDDRAYQVRTRSQHLLDIAKRRPPRTKYPLPQPGPLRLAYRWLALAALGLAFSGLGALLLAPLAGLAALKAQKDKLSPANESRARFVVLLASLLMILGAGLAFLFWLHVRG
jgi:hypothetical protein